MALKTNGLPLRVLEKSQCKPFWNLFTALRAGLQTTFRFHSARDRLFSEVSRGMCLLIGLFCGIVAVV